MTSRQASSYGETSRPGASDKNNATGEDSMNAVVLDHTALLVLGSGNRFVSRLVDGAHGEADRQVFVPSLCLAAAAAERAGLADHVGALPAIEVVELGFAGAGQVGELIGAGLDWRLAHAVDTGRPSVDWPAGRPIVTAVPEDYAKRGVRTINVAG